LQQPFGSYNKGEIIYSRFVSGNPRNNHMTESSFFFVEKQLSNGEWLVIATDANWETRSVAYATECELFLNIQF
jgi:neutral ceramidase